MLILCNVGCIHHTRYLNGTEYSIKHCHYYHEYSNEGYFHIQRHNHNGSTSAIGLILFGRIVGPAIMELIFHHHLHDGNHSHTLEATYRLPSSGTYNVSIEVRYENFDPNDYASSPVFYTDNELLSDTITYVQDKHFSDIKVHGSRNFENNFLHGFWRSSIPFSMPAKMPFIDLDDNNMTAIQSSRIKLLQNSLTYESRFHNYSNLDLENVTRPIANNSNIYQKICFVGDSQMRHMHNVFNEILSGRYEMLYFKGTKTIKSISNGDSVYLIIDNYARMAFTEQESMWLGNCSTIFLNFGQWHISWATKGDLGRGPFALSDYEGLVNRTLQAYIARMPSSVGMSCMPL